MSCIGKHGALSLEVTCDSTLKYGRHVLNRVERTGYSRATTIVYTHEYPLTLAKVETGQMSRLNARCLPIVANIRCIVLQRESLFRCYLYIYIYFLAFDFCRFCVVIRVFSSSPQRPMTSDFEGFSIPDLIHYIYVPILILEKEPVFSLLNVQC